MTCPCSPVDKSLGHHDVWYSMTCMVAIVRRFNPSFGPVRHVCLLKNYFIIIPMNMMIREIVLGRK